jgi:hypothetical protein
VRTPGTARPRLPGAVGSAARSRLLVCPAFGVPDSACSRSFLTPAACSLLVARRGPLPPTHPCWLARSATPPLARRGVPARCPGVARSAQRGCSQRGCSWRPCTACSQCGSRPKSPARRSAWLATRSLARATLKRHALSFTLCVQIVARRCSSPFKSASTN